MRYVLVVVTACLAAIPGDPASAQSADASVRMNQIVARFSKQKDVVKESHRVRIEKYKDMRAEPAIRSQPQEYSGTYTADFGFTLHLSVDANDRVSGSGADPLSGDGSVRRSFTLENAKLDGALLTGTKVFSGGGRERLEGVFINLTS